MHNKSTRKNYSRCSHAGTSKGKTDKKGKTAKKNAEYRAAQIANRKKAMKPYYNTRVANGMIILLCIIMLIVTLAIV
jgi:hypothetical protein